MIKPTIIFMSLLFFSCEKVEVERGQSVPTDKLANTNDGIPDISAIPLDEELDDPKEKFSFRLNLALEFTKLKFRQNIGSTFVVRDFINGDLLLHFDFVEAKDTNTDRNFYLIRMNKFGNILKSNRLETEFDSIHNVVLGPDDSIYLHGVPKDASPMQGQMVIKYNQYLEYVWKAPLPLNTTGSIQMLYKNQSIYLFTHSGEYNQKITAIKIHSVFGNILKATDQTQSARPSFFTQSNILVSTLPTVNHPLNNEFTYIYSNTSIPDKSQNYRLRYSFDFDQFSSEKMIDFTSMQNKITAKTQTCIDSNDEVYVYHSNELKLQKLSAFGEVVFETDIKEDFYPHIMSHGNGRIRCQEEKLQIIAKVEMNERNSDQVNILANFSKSNGQFIDTQLLTMRNTPSLNFETTMNGNGKGLFYKIIEIQDEFEPTIFEYEILFSGANY